MRSFATQIYVPTRARAADPRVIADGALTVVAGYFIRGRSTGDLDLLQVVPWTIDLTAEPIEAEGYGSPLITTPYDRSRPVDVQLAEFVERQGRMHPIAKPAC